ncbi:hypothetical protein ARMSODRAFT_1001418 [Armillaria solidipes]|uniref:Uncharacterized protein n=1 Tax=Armillaria solidipes TaxID=1076256 RepID=A0A2H3BQW7_9AGAR|nr:hypothetical protein ARMSODRAFT_1001418 [Armillaria solidipes]
MLSGSGISLGSWGGLHTKLFHFTGGPGMSGRDTDNAALSQQENGGVPIIKSETCFKSSVYFSSRPSLLCGIRIIQLTVDHGGMKHGFCKHSIGLQSIVGSFVIGTENSSEIGPTFISRRKSMLKNQMEPESVLFNSVDGGGRMQVSSSARYLRFAGHGRRPSSDHHESGIYLVQTTVLLGYNEDRRSQVNDGSNPDPKKSIKGSIKYYQIYQNRQAFRARSQSSQEF